MQQPVPVLRLDDDAIYDDGSLVLTLGVTPTKLAKARRTGTLRYSRCAGRNLYFGRWVREWIEAPAQGNPTASDQRESDQDPQGEEA